MNRRDALCSLQHWVLKRLVRLRAHLPGSASWSPATRNRRLTFIAVDFHNTCSTFLRAYYLSSATGAKLEDGSPVSTSRSFDGVEDALTYAVNLTGRGRGNGPWQRRQEPPWHDSDVFLRLLNSAGCSNAAGVNAAWSIGTDALAHLTRARNYFAHRNAETARRLRSLSRAYGVSSPAQPDALLLMKGAGRPQAILEDWLDDLETVFALMPA